MTSESKILTVSYGTFSCTLEGFDDPFNTMKAIAEYFRDLTAEDRYFGAEPPQPDAAMLHRIAEREVSRLVDARVRESGARPRPQDAPATPAAAQPATAQPATVEPAVDDGAAPSLQDAVPNGVAARLARIRQSVNPLPFAADLPAEALSPMAEDLATEDFAAEDSVAEDLTTADLGSEDFSDAAEVETAEVAGSDAAEAAADDFSRDALDQLDALLRAPVDSPAATDAAEDATLSPAPDDTLADAALPEETPDLAASLTEALLEDPLPEALTSADADDAAEVTQPEVRASDDSRVVRLRPGDDTDTADDRAEVPTDPQATRKPSSGDEDAEMSRLLRQADDVMAETENRRRIDSIAHLKAAVVATEADRAVTGESKPAPGKNLDPYREDLAKAVQPDTPANPPAKTTPEVKPRRKSVSVRPQEPRPGTIRPGMMGPPPLVLVSEQRIDRVAPPQAPKAPPAAVKAPTDTPAAQPAPPREGQPVVALRTGRLTGAIGSGANPASQIPPRQKIVLEQTSQGGSSDADDEDDHEEDLTATEQAGLIDFAERVGVKSMAEMLEAAAAYATCVEKRSQFTRPQLMRRLMASAGDRNVSREDGLRSFGTLLRTGRIEKVSRGHYMLAESSPYLAEARRLS